MNFFEYQEQARRSSRYLVVLFLIATLLIIGFLDLVISSFYLLSSQRIGMQYSDIPLSVHAWVSGSIAIFILLVSLFRLLSIRKGGYKVAEALGGRRLTASKNSSEELRLLNIVEEMAIAAGTETPVVYVLEDSAINAFAAGLTTHDAVIGVTRGAIDLLNREEMQGVIAHEFSHILNGDMRLNLQMIGVLFGITFISYMGNQIIRTGARSKDSAPLVIVGVCTIIIGFVGIFFASMIKAAISRQREYLADASAVQYTRNNLGIANALKKIGGWTIGSHLAAPKASEYSHFYIADGVSMIARGLFETHPPLKARISRIDPQWDGEFPLVKRTRQQIMDHHKRKKVSDAQSFKTSAKHIFNAENNANVSVAAITSAIALTGMPNMDHVQYAQNMLSDIPSNLLRDIHQPLNAYAIVLLLLIHNDIDNWEKRIAGIDKDMSKIIMSILREHVPIIKGLPIKYRLPLLELAMPALKSLSVARQGIFKKDVIKTLQSNNKIELWEWSLYRIIRLSLNQPEPTTAKYSRFSQVKNECELILATISHLGSKDKTKQQSAFYTAAAHLGLQTSSPEKFTLSTSALRQALQKVAQLRPLLKPRFLKALVLAVQSNDEIEVEEVELIRAISESIDCPMPPILSN